MTELIESPFLFIGNLLCLDFVNTENKRTGELRDWLSSPDDLKQWLTEAGVLTPDDSQVGAYSEYMLHEARRLRTLTRSVAEHLAQETPLSAEIVEEINVWLGHSRGRTQIELSFGKFHRGFQFEEQGGLELLAPLVESLVALVCDADPHFIHKCENPVCVLYFYDTTKNHRRHWCQMQTCGNRMKAAAHYRRTKGQDA